ncbi:acid-sensing ion channel 5-like [Uloborus diversus]|uniref:acid-sensing ion channel 5-like n=1 Tax=Uloborus diversus TaxID=327109 RepID=UPI00240A5CEB|nr:acid-sensing ion channel 5-like [Uloborus diversus]
MCLAKSLQVLENLEKEFDLMTQKGRRCRRKNSFYSERNKNYPLREMQYTSEHLQSKTNNESYKIFTEFPQKHKNERKRFKGKNFLNHQQSRRLLKISGFLCIIIGCLYQCFSFLLMYLEYPTTVEFNVVNEATTDFPAVTVCNSNPVRYKIWCTEEKYVCDHRRNETLEDLRIRQGDLYDRLSKDKRIKLGYQKQDFIIYAEYEEENVTDEFSWYYDYEFTNCFTFNARWDGKNNGSRSAFVFNPVTGMASELLLCVNMDVDNYSNITGSVYGRIRLTIHEDDIVPNPTYDAASLEAGGFYSYGVQKVTTTLLEWPYQTKCRNYKEEKEIRDWC